MSKIDDILLNQAKFANKLGIDLKVISQAKDEILQLVLEVVGEDEAESKQNYGKDYYTQVRNAQRAEQRQKAYELFGKEQE